ncbi:MAG: hypothetical protein AAGK66_05575 [Pseudomonadota bacterium]
MRTILGLLFGSFLVVACESTPSDPYAGSSILQEEKARYVELISVQAEKSTANMQTAIGCVVDLSSVSGALQQEGDSVGSSVYNAIGDVYRERITVLVNSGEVLPEDVAAWYEKDNFEAFDTYFKARQATLEVDGSNISESAENCRKRVVDQMSEDEVTTLALNAAITAN